MPRRALRGWGGPPRPAPRRQAPEHPSSVSCAGTIGSDGQRCAGWSADQQPAVDHALERLAVAVALDAPARQREVAARLEVQVDAVSVGAQAGLAHRLVASALEVLGKAQDDRAALE